MKPRIEQLFNTKVDFISYYRNKETHGDLDILILNDGNLGNIRDKIAKEFETDFIYSNGNVYSFPFENYQIDIIPTPTKFWETSKTFFDYDPTGNLMGKIAHKFGLKYGFCGLVYPFRNFSGRISADIIISKDSRKIFNFLDFDYDRYLKGFDTLDEIFNYIISSKYFNVENFKIENLRHIDRKRNAKRSTYQKFLTFINENNIKSNFEFDKDKSIYLTKINNCFPEINFLTKLKELKLKDEENKLIAEKFNGNLIMEKFSSLKGKELGLAIRNFKDSFETTEKFKEYILKFSTEEILKDFENCIL